MNVIKRNFRLSAVRMVLHIFRLVMRVAVVRTLKTAQHNSFIVTVLVLVSIQAFQLQGAYFTSLYMYIIL